MIAVIMAAGLGSRFGMYTESRPKAFIEVGGKSMIERSLDTLIGCGIHRIIIGTGYRREAFEDIACRYMAIYPDVSVECCFSPKYAETNSMYTLYNLRHLIDDDYLLLESDLVFEPQAITSLLADPHPDIMLTSPVTKFQDQYYVEFDSDGWLTNCSTDKAQVNTGSELVGIHKLSIGFSDCLMQEYGRISDCAPKLGYEFALLDVARRIRRLYVLNLEGLLWYEIDDAADKDYAERNIVVKMRKKCPVMISPNDFIGSLRDHDINFFAGVPDSLLKNVCAYITDNVEPNRNIITANEGAAIALAAGHHLATGEIAAVYMQNSGEGNIINPLLSLTDAEVYGIPVLLLIGWRGKPGVHDEPQHVKQGKVTTSILDAIGIRWAVLSKSVADMRIQVEDAVRFMSESHESFAFIIEKDTFEPYSLANAPELPSLTLGREEAIGRVAAAVGAEDCIVSTTGMISRELFEYREARGMSHAQDFLTVGSMGHASQIALGIALEKTDRTVWCFDGDGAAIMHMGSMAIIGARRPSNLIHVVFNNGAHDSVGGQPTVGLDIDMPAIALACGYASALSVDSMADLESTLGRLPAIDRPALIEIKVKKGNRPDLGRPTTTPAQNKRALMDFLK